MGARLILQLTVLAVQIQRQGLVPARSGPRSLVDQPVTLSHVAFAVIPLLHLLKVLVKTLVMRLEDESRFDL